MLQAAQPRSNAYMHSHGSQNILSMLPSEVRNMIWSLAVPSNQTFSVSRPTKGIKCFSSLPHLTLVCKQVRAETVQMFYHNNRFVVHVSIPEEGERYAALEWFLAIPSHHFASIRSLRLVLDIRCKARLAPHLGIVESYSAVIAIDLLSQRLGETDATVVATCYEDVRPLERLEVRRLASQISQVLSRTGATQDFISMVIVALCRYYAQWNGVLPSCTEMRSAQEYLKLMKTHLGQADADMSTCLESRIRLVQTAVEMLCWS